MRQEPSQDSVSFASHLFFFFFIHIRQLAKQMSFDSAKLVEKVQALYGYRPRPFQLAATESICAGKDTVVIAPTGSGKSLLFRAVQLGTPERKNGMVIVVTPLKALQVEQASL